MEKEIQDLFDSLTARIDAQDATITDLNQKIDDQNQTITDLNSKVDNLTKSISNLKSAGSELEEVAEKKIERPTIPTKKFKVDKVEYRFNAPTFNLPIDPENKSAAHGQMTAEAALEDDSILKRLVASGAGVIEKVI